VQGARREYVLTFSASLGLCRCLLHLHKIQERELECTTIMQVLVRNCTIYFIFSVRSIRVFRVRI
jgi:hypothetical protein